MFSSLYWDIKNRIKGVIYEDRGAVETIHEIERIILACEAEEDMILMDACAESDNDEQIVGAA